MLLYRLGSDPEMLFTKQADFLWKKIPSLQVFNCDKETGLKSFIGCDAHPATAEIRPGAAISIDRHLIDLAHAMRAINGYLRSAPNPVRLMALPWVDDEALGGHIHLSFFFDDPNAKFVMETLNQIFHVGATRPYDLTIPTPNMFDQHDEAWKKLYDYTLRAATAEAFTPEVVCKVLNYLTVPFENWVQPWQEREKRYSWCMNSPHYNQDPNYLVRWVPNTRPKNKPRLSKLAYLHVEYRTPSTWLHHPALAYVYFALAKLTMLNFKTIRDKVFEAQQIVVFHDSPGNHIFKEVFDERLAKLLPQLSRSSPDLKYLPEALKVCERSRERWYGDRFSGVDFSAWENLLG